MGTCAICCKYFKSFKQYQEHHKLAHNVSVSQVNKIQPVRHTTRTKMEIVHDYETLILKPHLVVPDSLEFMGTIHDGVKDVPFYLVRMYEHAFNGQTLSLEYLQELGITNA